MFARRSRQQEEKGQQQQKSEQQQQQQQDGPIREPDQIRGRRRGGQGQKDKRSGTVAQSLVERRPPHSEPRVGHVQPEQRRLHVELEQGQNRRLQKGASASKVPAEEDAVKGHDAQASEHAVQPNRHHVHQFGEPAGDHEVPTRNDHVEEQAAAAARVHGPAAAEEPAPGA